MKTIVAQAYPTTRWRVWARGGVAISGREGNVTDDPDVEREQTWPVSVRANLVRGGRSSANSPHRKDLHAAAPHRRGHSQPESGRTERQRLGPDQQRAGRHR